MKHFVLTCSFLLFCNLIFSQSNAQLQQVKPKWKLGDQKRVHTKTSSKVYLKDSLFNNTEVIASYNMKVVDTIKNFTLLYYQDSDSLNVETNFSDSKFDSVANFLTEIIKKIEKDTKEFKYELLVNKSTGQAFKVKNSDKYLKFIEQVTFNLIEELGRKKEKTTIQIDSMKQKVFAYFKMAEPKILETAINEFNYIMQPYSYSYPYNSTISYKAMIHDVNAMGTFGGIEMPAVLTISSKQIGNTLTIKTDTDYDKDFLLEQIKKKYKNLNTLVTSDIYLSEKVETIFKTTNNWLVSHKSDVAFEMKEVRVVNKTVVSIQ